MNVFSRLIGSIRHTFRDVTTGGQRSAEWPKVERAFRRKQPACAACGSTSRIQVHHKRPFHLFPELELEESNLISLCMGPNMCHLLIGHGDNFRAWNPNVELDAANALGDPTHRSDVITRAKLDRKDGD